MVSAGAGAGTGAGAGADGISVGRNVFQVGATPTTTVTTIIIAAAWDWLQGWGLGRTVGASSFNTHDAIGVIAHVSIPRDGSCSEDTGRVLLVVWEGGVPVPMSTYLVGR